MEVVKGKFKNILLFLNLRINLIVVLVSFISLLFIFFKIINLDIILGFSENLILNSLFHTIISICTVFTILFLPTYPIFFIIFKEKSFNYLEKLSLTIVVNSAFYILMGYIGYILGFLLTKFFFFFSLLIMYFFIIGYISIFELKKNSYTFLRSKDISTIKTENLNLLSLLKYFKKIIPFNALLLIIFLFLICILNVVKADYFIGTDPWLHILNSRIITDIKILPLEGYHGTMGLNIFGAVINFFSGANHTLIPRYFVFYTFFVSGLIFYNICMRVFKNQNLALFGVFLLEFSSLGFSTMMIQYWPSGSALIKCLTIFFLFYVRIQDFTKFERPTKKLIFSNMFFDYALITVIFISSVLTHDVTTLFFLISFLWLFLIYFLRDYKRGFDFILLCGLLLLFIIFSIFGIGEGHYWFFISLDIPWSFLILGALGGGLIGFIIIWKIQKSINFTKGKFNKVIKGETDIFYKKVEDKIIIPFISSILIIVLIILLIINFAWINLELINIFYVIEIIMISSFAIWGLLLFQKKRRGKALFIWGLGLLLFLGIGFIFNILALSNMIWQRILYLIPPILVIGFIAYIYKLIKLNSIRTFQKKYAILFILIFSLLTTYFYESKAFDIFIMKGRDVSAIQWYSNRTSHKNVIITEVGWSHAFKYYGYPFDNKTEALLYDHNFYFLKYQIDLFPPNNHLNESGINILKEIKKEYNTDVYIIFADDYIINRGFELFGQLTDEELEQYYNLTYINKICSAKSINKKETPLFWII
ncbi:MAG: hypothetical protein ACFFBF_08425 [Promethearchaeota archaeon]